MAHAEFHTEVPARIPECPRESSVSPTDGYFRFRWAPLPTRK